MFRFLTSGESHGKCLNAIIEGIPAGFKLTPEDINFHLSRRQKGYGRGGRMQIENDNTVFNSGIRHGFTTGAPICLEIKNKDWENWQIPMSTTPIDLTVTNNAELINQKKITHVRPGHADLAGALKYNHKDIRDVLERSSARETATRVAVGAIAQAILKQFGIEIFSHVIRIGSAAVDLKALPEDYKIIKEFAEKSEVSCADYAAALEMKKVIDEAKEQGDTLGGIFEVVALNVPVGLGSYVHWDKRLDGQIAQAIMSIPAIKTVSLGLGKASGSLFGSKVHDEIFPKEEDSTSYERKTNNSGGIEGGMSNGEPIIVKSVMKPIPTLKTPLKSINLKDGSEHSAHYERSDVCAVPAAAVVGESMLAITLLNAFFEKFGGDSFEEIKFNFDHYCEMYKKR